MEMKKMCWEGRGWGCPWGGGKEDAGVATANAKPPEVDLEDGPKLVAMNCAGMSSPGSVSVQLGPKGPTEEESPAHIPANARESRGSGEIEPQHDTPMDGCT